MIKTPSLLLKKALRRTPRLLSSYTEAWIVRTHLKRAGVAHAEKIFSYTTKHELQALFNLAVACPTGANVLEIGSHLGASTCYLAAGLRASKGNLFCVDTWQNETMPEGETDTFVKFRKNTQNINHLLTLCRKRSSDLSENDVSLPLHLVFIDGDHSYESVKGDFEKIAPWVAKDGIVAFHDCLYFEGVSRVIGESLANGEWMIVDHIRNLLWIKRAGFS